MNGWLKGSAAALGIVFAMTVFSGESYAEKQNRQVKKGETKKGNDQKNKNNPESSSKKTDDQDKVDPFDQGYVQELSMSQMTKNLSEEIFETQKYINRKVN